jgi:hypothetical protein
MTPISHHANMESNLIRKTGWECSIDKARGVGIFPSE